MDGELPPILRTPGLHIVDWGVTENGKPFLRLSANKHKTTHINVRSIIVYLVSDQPGEWMFAYSYIDNETNTLITKHGPYGDPERDSDGDWISLPK